MRHALVTIDLQALAHNLKIVKKFSPKAKVMAMVKANAYGHGAIDCLSALALADALGVACLSEAKPLIQAGWQKPIVLIEGVFSLEEWQYATQHQLQCVIHHQQQLDWALSYPSSQPVWLKFNTGMNRLGFSENDILIVAEKLHDVGYQLILTSHFANADDIQHPKNQQQQQQFNQVLQHLKTHLSPNIQGSLCNSAGIINWQEHHYDWVRAGIMLYGATPVNHLTAKEIGLKPVMQFEASIMAIHQLNTGETVGYGSRWQAKKPCRIAIVSVGYGDGYPRVVSQRAYLSTDTGQTLPIIGRVAMDMLMVDITHAENIQIGTIVQLWGNRLTVDAVADWNNTISYEILCLVTNRPKRIVK